MLAVKTFIIHHGDHRARRKDWKRKRSYRIERVRLTETAKNCSVPSPLPKEAGKQGFFLCLRASV